MPQQAMIQGKEGVADNTAEPDRRQALVPRNGFPAILAPSRHRVALHLGMRDRDFIDLRRNEALCRNQRSQRARREGAAAETEDVDLVPRLPVPAQEAVKLADVGRHTDAGCAVERGQRRPARGANAFDVVGDLIGLGAVQRLVEAPHVGFLGSEGVAGPVREKNEFSVRSRRAVLAALPFVAPRGTFDKRLIAHLRHQSPHIFF
jgi:hypothetical protein